MVEEGCQFWWRWGVDQPCQYRWMRAHGHNQLRTYRNVAFHTTRFVGFFFRGRTRLQGRFRRHRSKQAKGEGEHDEVPVPHNALHLARLEIRPAQFVFCRFVIMLTPPAILLLKQ